MRRCGTFRHVCRFYQSLDPHIQVCSCGATEFVTPLGLAEDQPEYDDDWDADEYDNAPEPTGVIDREEYFWATYDYDDEEEEED